MGQVPSLREQGAGGRHHEQEAAGREEWGLVLGAAAPRMGFQPGRCCSHPVTPKNWRKRWEVFSQADFGHLSVPHTGQ